MNELILLGLIIFGVNGLFVLSYCVMMYFRGKSWINGMRRFNDSYNIPGASSFYFYVSNKLFVLFFSIPYFVIFTL